jgi:hypothetical protein
MKLIDGIQLEANTDSRLDVHAVKLELARNNRLLPSPLLPPCEAPSQWDKSGGRVGGAQEAGADVEEEQKERNARRCRKRA